MKSCSGYLLGVVCRAQPGVWILILCAAMILNGCGFKLRGEVSLPSELERTFVTGVGEQDELGAELRRRLRGHDVKVVDKPQEATATVRLGGERRSRTVLAVNEQGKALEYTLSLGTTVEVKGKKNKVLLPRQSLVVSRDFIFDQNQVLGSTAEAEVTYADMRLDLVRIIMYRLQAIR